MKFRYNSIVRLLEIQLKNGYIKSAPKEFEFLKRYPPLSGDDDMMKPQTSTKSLQVPYKKYYDKALERNPKMVGEHVYLAYWREEPLAMILAKKQYEYILKGFDEETAYQKALDHINVLESNSYEALKSAIDSIRERTQSRMPITADEELNKLISRWREKLQRTPYEDLLLEQQGELDYVIQTKVLKWGEVERERRMLDPVFYRQFVRLRLTLFPEIKSVLNMEKLEKRRQQLMLQYLRLTGLRPDLLCTQSPFYYNDYLFFFNKLRAQPLLKHWNERDRRGLSKWIVQVLSYRLILEKYTPDDIQKCLDCVRGQFFPMINFPRISGTFTIPNIAEIKALLYHHDIGYKRENNKLFIKRYYRLPLLLFPKEALVAALLADTSKANAIADESGTSILQQEMKYAGIDMRYTQEIKQKFTECFRNRHTVPAPAQQSPFPSVSAAPNTADDVAIDMSFIDELLRDQLSPGTTPAVTGIAALAKSSVKSVESDNRKLAVEEGEDEENESFFSDDDDAGGIKNSETTDAVADSADSADSINNSNSLAQRTGADYTPFNSLPRDQLTPEEWNKLVEKYVRTPRTELERDRAKLLRKSEKPGSLEKFRHEVELYNFQRERNETEVILRARLETLFTAKDQARRAAEWKRRGAWQDIVPAPHINLKDEDM